jgi:hypothetical protein
MSEPKEPNYFCTDLHEEADKFHNKSVNFFRYRTKDKYLNLFQNEKGEKIIGESSVRYFYSRVAPSKIKRFNPKTKIIILLRDPVDFLYSYHSQILKSHENIKKFKKALKLEEKRKYGKKIPKKTICPSFLYYSELYHFSKYIKNYKNVFSENQIKIILLDDLKNKPYKTYEDILKFLNVEDIKFKPSLERKNPNKNIKIKSLNNFLQSKKYTTIKKPIQKIMTKSIRKRIYFFIKNRNTKIQPRKPMGKNLEFKLKKTI